ncbi:lipoprotein insertase outer membrane protein LolB [Vibrio vulnificus]|nr:lipoprotein localization protein LolB [Vibrio vulnificus]EHH1190536.1 lipoprotein localization protein LolB [Vibrio vulnificus]EHK2773619.1 lipoprotein localization protein LolB [Vibrio vulnificus]EIA1296376.1 lipoprotein localization protein LolB [Vibrio vulnificus]EIA1303197.1 lipoprotein localization protein LolB [Vibrio vulnificus]
MFRRTYFWLMLLPLFMVGCTGLPEHPTSVEWQSHQAKLSQIQSFQAVGKLGYISPEQRQNLNFYWKHSPAQSNLRFTTFLGQTALNLTMTPQGARVETYDDQILTAKNATALVQQLTGLVIPVEQLSDWIIGLPNGADDFQLNEQNTLGSLEKELNFQRWHIAYTQYRDVEFHQQVVPLPAKLSLTQQDIKLNIVVSKWTLK